jgi:hypothetical protein
MKEYVVDLLRGPHAEIFSVQSHTVYSTHELGRKLETTLKTDFVELETILAEIQQLPPEEMNYIWACFCTWAYGGAFQKACASGQMPAEILIAQETGDYEFGDYYYASEWSPLKCRQIMLKGRAEHYRTEITNIESELAELARREQAVAAVG